MNKIVIITGATSGFGLATATKFKEQGDTVIIASRNKEKVDAVVEQYGFAAGFVIDVTDYTKWLELKQFVLQTYGRIDILVNNAGCGVKIADTTEQTKETIDQTVAINLNSVIYGASVFEDVMKEQKDGIIINLSSVCARHCWAGWSVYAAYQPKGVVVEEMTVWGTDQVVQPL